MLIYLPRVRPRVAETPPDVVNWSNTQLLTGTRDQCHSCAGLQPAEDTSPALLLLGIPLPVISSFSRHCSRADGLISVTALPAYSCQFAQGGTGRTSPEICPRPCNRGCRSRLPQTPSGNGKPTLLKQKNRCALLSRL